MGGRSASTSSYEAHVWWRLTAEVVITLRPRRSKRVWIPREPFPIVRIILPRQVRRQPVPHPGVDLQHLRLLDDLDVQRGASATHMRR